MSLKPLQFFTYNNKYQDSLTPQVIIQAEVVVIIFNINVFKTVSKFISKLNIKFCVGSKLTKSVCQKLNCHILIGARDKGRRDAFLYIFLIQ